MLYYLYAFIPIECLVSAMRLCLRSFFAAFASPLYLGNRLDGIYESVTFPDDWLADLRVLYVPVVAN